MPSINGRVLDIRRLTNALASAGMTAPIRELSPLRGGLDNRVYTAETIEGQQVVIKIRRKTRARYDVAAWAADQLAAAEIPAPGILWHSENICVETRCPGQPLTDGASPTEPTIGDLAVARSAGRLLRRMHTIAVHGFGTLDTTGTGRHPLLRDWLIAEPPGDLPLAAGSDLAALAARVRVALRSGIDHLPDIAPRLLHGDWAARHIIADAGVITGIVDLESVRGGDPLADIAGWSLQEPALLTAALLDGYFREPPDAATSAALALYRIRIAASLLRHHLRHGDTNAARIRAAQMNADLEDLTQGHALSMPRIDPASAITPHRPARRLT